MGLHNRDTFRVPFDDGWVELREKITAGDRRAAMNRAMKTSFGADGQVKGEFLTGDFKLGLLYRMIVAWSDEEPVTEEAIDELPEEITDKLLEELDARNVMRTEEERGPLSRTST